LAVIFAGKFFPAVYIDVDVTFRILASHCLEWGIAFAVNAEDRIATDQQKEVLKK
jgi:hypothetical protein